LETGRTNMNWEGMLQGLSNLADYNRRVFVRLI